jgi:flagellar biosynthesis protein FlhF
MCKWLATDVFRRGRTGRVVKVEFDRPNPTEQLAVFCEALGLSFEHYPVSLATPAKTFLYLDLPALSVRRPADNAPLAKFFSTERIEGRVLVLNATSDAATLRDAYAAGRELGATHLVFTHLDELSQWGKLWDYLLDDGLEPLFLATGPSLTGDCEEAVHGAVLRRTLPGA